MEISGAFMDKVSLQEATLTASEANTPTLSGCHSDEDLL